MEEERKNEERRKEKVEGRNKEKSVMEKGGRRGKEK